MDDAHAKKRLDLAARLALRAEGRVEPNPLVGCVLEKDGQLIGMGHHRVWGGPHAERDALANARARGNDPKGSTAYVTLEPCCHHGKQPPCTDALVEAGVAKVVYAVADPGEESGNGAAVLRDAGIEAVHCDVSCDALAVGAPFLHRLATGLPWVIAKWAQTIDGRIATRTGESQWISGPRSRRRVHQRRAKVDVILTGIGTVLADDPMLTARDVRVRRVARRVVIDAGLETPLESKLVQTAREVPTAIACAKDLVTAGITERRVEALEAAGVTVMGVPENPEHPGRLRLDMLMRALVDRFDTATVFVEAGAGLLGALFEADLVCESVVYLAPTLMGDERALPAATGRVATKLSDARRFKLGRVKRVGDDVELVYRSTRV
ncbi:MAG: bifunctional diaminohydroxyphosphoribosylaminopyrimidine deaminase/5-amino-6-(5-phosphoribosylamino)uracil reductase RibD [Planctomycetota bacterium]